MRAESLNELPRGSMRRVVNFLGTCANVADRLQARREIGLADTGRVEGRRVTGRESVAHLALSLRAAVRRPWARFLPPLSEPGVPISGTGLSSGIMRLAHGASRSWRAIGCSVPWHQAHTLALAGRCVVRPVDALTTATAQVVPFAWACDDVRRCCSYLGVIGTHERAGCCSSAMR